jgi:hypothetical protein
VEIGMIEYDRE